MSKRDTATPPIALPPMMPLPSVRDLVCRLSVLCRAADGSLCEHDEAREWADAQDLAIRNLVATMPAMTLADAAAQLYVMSGVIEYRNVSTTLIHPGSKFRLGS